MRVPLFLFLPTFVFGQVANFQKDFNSINEGLMLTLGSYAVANFAVSGVGYYTSDNEATQRFHEMNVMWNTVNLGLAVPGYLRAKRDQEILSSSSMKVKQQKTERLFLINAMLDVGYVGAGYYLRSQAPNHPGKEAIFRGYGNSLMLQGSYLFVFDLVAYGIHKNHFNKDFEAWSKQISLRSSPNGVRLVVALDGLGK